MFIKKSSSALNFKKLIIITFQVILSLSGNVLVPGDKSISQRALIISLISVEQLQLKIYLIVKTYFIL